ncbi:MAG: hypothetical protein QM719_13095 [Thermomonas sp.]
MLYKSWYERHENQRLKSDLQNLDEKIHQEDWRFNERLISRSKRSKWLLVSARKKVVISSFVFFALLAAMLITACIYNAVNSRAEFLHSLRFNFDHAYSLAKNGGIVSALFSGATPSIIFLFFSSRIKHIGFFVLSNDSSMTGSLGNSKDGVPMIVIIGAIFSAFIFLITSATVDNSQINSWWQASIAGGISCGYLHPALEKVADAVNVARMDTIERHGTFLDDGPRRYI